MNHSNQFQSIYIFIFRFLIMFFSSEKIIDMNTFQLNHQDVIDSKKNGNCARQNPPPKRDPPSNGRSLTGALQITIGTDFFKALRPWFGGSKAHRI